MADYEIGVGTVSWGGDLGWTHGGVTVSIDTNEVPIIVDDQGPPVKIFSMGKRITVSANLAETVAITLGNSYQYKSLLRTGATFSLIKSGVTAISIPKCFLVNLDFSISSIELRICRVTWVSYGDDSGEI